MGAEKKKKVVEEKKEPEPRTPAFDRPQRERKSVERLVATIDKDAVKEFQIEKVFFLLHFQCVNLVLYVMW
jgi:protein DEK